MPAHRPPVASRSDAARLRAANRRTAWALALIALLFFAGTLASRQLGPKYGLAAVGCAAFAFIVFAIGRHLRRRPGERRSHPMTSATASAANRSLARRLGVVIAVMFGFGFLLVPFYEKICEVTGIRDLARADPAVNVQVDATRRIRVELDGNVRSLAWEFRPRVPLADAHPGELVQVVYEVVNTGDRTLTGQAIPSYAPREAGRYFRKLDCFCFTAQTLAAGERREMPVVFVIDPKLPREITAITLSYTFFEVEGATAKVAIAGDRK